MGDPDYPVYQGNTDESGHRRITEQFYDSRRLFDGVSDKLYFVLAGIASLWLAAVGPWSRRYT